MLHKPNQRRPLGQFRVLVLNLIIFYCCFINLINAAKKSKSGIKKTLPVMPGDYAKNAEKIYELSYKTPFRFHYTPWITRKLLLTLNITSTNTQYFALDQLNTLTTEDLEYDYDCGHLSVQRNKPQVGINPTINSEDFKDAKNLNCYEKVYLQELVKMLDNTNITNHWSKCEEFNKNTIGDICKKADEIGERLKDKYVDEKGAHDELKNIFDNYSLKYCSKFVLKDVISQVNRKRMIGQQTYNGTCEGILTELVQLDALVNFFSCEFDEILSRIYCQGYSVKKNCEECSIAYKQWLCSMTLPYYIEDLLIKPCLSICQRVERTCPYLHPEMKDQYGGEPIFICNDPAIPLASNSIDEPYGKDRVCFQKCHLEANHTLTLKGLVMKNQTTNTVDEGSIEPLIIGDEDALIENPDLEICIPKENITKRLRLNKNVYEDNETLEQRLKLENQTKNEKTNQSKRDLFAKWSIEDGYSSARMVDQIELEEEEIVEEVNKESNKESVVALEQHNKNQQDDIYYLDGNSSLVNEETNQTNHSSALENEQQPIKSIKQNFVSERKELKFRTDQRQDISFNHFSEDDENDNEDGDSDLDQVISTTTITSLNYAVNKRPAHLEKNKK